MASKVTSTAACLGKAAFRTTPQRIHLPLQSSTYTTCRTIQCGVSAQRPTIVQQKQHLPTLTKALSARNASTSTSTSTSQNTSTAAQTTLTWDEFLKLRRTRRYVNLVASIFSGAGSIAVATPLIAEYEIESIGAQITGLDPMFVIGGSLMAVGGVGWLMGPFLGTAFFKIWKSSVATEFARVSWSISCELAQTQRPGLLAC